MKKQQKPRGGVKMVPARPLPPVKLYYCEQCTAQIAPDVIRRRRYSTAHMPQHFFCDGRHRDLWLAAQNHYAKISKIGNASIADIKAKTGKVPGPPRGGARPGSGKRKKQSEQGETMAHQWNEKKQRYEVFSAATGRMEPTGKDYTRLSAHDENEATPGWCGQCKTVPCLIEQHRVCCHDMVRVGYCVHGPFEIDPQ